MRNVSENRRSFGSASLFKACQAISMAMTTVLPVPVAIFIATRLSPGFDDVVGLAEPFSIQLSPTSGRLR